MQRLSEKQIEYTAVYVIFPQLLLGQIAVKPGYFLLFPSSALLLLLINADYLPRFQEGSSSLSQCDTYIVERKDVSMHLDQATLSGSRDTLPAY